jgi:rhodanese-related sulfurtransferase
VTIALWIVAGVALLAGLGALRWAGRLSASIDQLKRDKYYIDSRLKRIPEEIREAVEPLRHHVAAIADGGSVPRDLILQGRLFVDISAEEARAVIQQDATGSSGKVLLIDVRTPREYAVRRIPGAKLVPFEELDTRYRTEIPADAEKIFVYCMGGERSRSACDFLSRRGYPNLYNIREGLQGWQGNVEGEGEMRLVQIEPVRTNANG